MKVDESEIYRVATTNPMLLYVVDSAAKLKQCILPLRSKLFGNAVGMEIQVFN